MARPKVSDWNAVELAAKIESGEIIECAECGALYYADEGAYVDGDFVCDDCLESGEFSHCDHCGSWCREITEVDAGNGVTEWWCDGCVDDYAVECRHCGGYVDRHFTSEVGGETVCDRCLYDSGDYGECVDCGGWFSADDLVYDEDEDEYCCEYCYSQRSSKFVYGYHEYPSEFPPMDGDPDALLMGVELEVDAGGESHDNARSVATALVGECDDRGDYLRHGVRIAHDGSLDDGFEIISNPATLSYHANSYDWSSAMAKAVKMGYKSHDTNTCGLHVHVNRRFFGGNMDNPELAMALLLQNNREWLVMFSRRERWTYCRFPEDASTFTPDAFKGTKEVPDLRERSVAHLRELLRHYSGHHAALNFDGHSTVEFRFFKGTLKHSTFLACLQLVAMMAEAAKFRLEQVATIDLRWFIRLAKRRGYAEFLGYLKERGIQKQA